MNAFFFWLFSSLMIVCALAVVLGRNPVTSAMCFAATIFFMSGLFVLLSAFFLAAVQILVTAGAVMVLFLFIIMLLDLTGPEKIPRQTAWMACSLVLALGFLYIVALTLNATPEGAVGINAAPRPLVVSDRAMAGLTKDHPALPQGLLADFSDDTHRIGRLLFSTKLDPDDKLSTTYVAPFEVTSLLILVATIGVIVLCKQDDPRRPNPRGPVTREAPPKSTKPETVSTR